MTNRLNALTAPATTTDSNVEAIGRGYVDALMATVRSDPDAFGLRSAMLAAGERLITAVETLEAAGPAAFGPINESTATDWHDAFLANFVRAVAGEGTSVTDAMVRRSATECGETLLTNSRMAATATDDNAGEGGLPLADSLFCLLFGGLVSGVIAQFVNSLVTAHLTLAVPILPVLDPAGLVTKWVSGHIAGLIPDPCSRQGAGDSVTDVARELLQETVERALGLDPTEVAAL